MFSYYLLPVGDVKDPVAAQDRWESALAEATRPCWEASSREDILLTVQEHWVLLRGASGLIFMLSCRQDGFDDEISVADHMGYLVSVVTTACDGRLTAAQIVAFHGKVCVCVNELFFGGMRVYSDAATVVRNAKLKAPPS